MPLLGDINAQALPQLQAFKRVQGPPELPAMYHRGAGRTKGVGTEVRSEPS